MKSPWVSRTAYDLLLEERDHLRAQVEKLTDHHVRMERTDRNMSEIPKEAPKPREPMPSELSRYINAAATVSMQRSMRSVAYKRHADGEAWDSIVADVVVPEEPRERFLQAEGFEDGTEAETESS